MVATVITQAIGFQGSYDQPHNPKSVYKEEQSDFVCTSYMHSTTHTESFLLRTHMANATMCHFIGIYSDQQRQYTLQHMGNACDHVGNLQKKGINYEHARGRSFQKWVKKNVSGPNAKRFSCYPPKYKQIPLHRSLT